MPRRPAAPSFTQRIAFSHRKLRSLQTRLQAAEDRELRGYARATKPKGERATYIRSERERRRREDANRRTQPTSYYPAAAASEGRGVHFWTEPSHPFAGTFRMVTSKGDVLATCTVYGDDEVEYQTIESTLAAILDQKDPV